MASVSWSCHATCQSNSTWLLPCSLRDRQCPIDEDYCCWTRVYTSVSSDRDPESSACLCTRRCGSKENIPRSREKSRSARLPTFPQIPHASDRLCLEARPRAYTAQCTSVPARRVGNRSAGRCRGCPRGRPSAVWAGSREEHRDIRILDATVRAIKKNDVMRL